MRKRKIHTTDDPKEAWLISSLQYVKPAFDNVGKHLSEKKKANLNMKLPKPRDAPISSNYFPELDESEEFDEVDDAYYQSLIGVLRWIVELRKIDINVKVPILSSRLALPRFMFPNNCLTYSIIFRNISKLRWCST